MPFRAASPPADLAALLSYKRSVIGLFEPTERGVYGEMLYVCRALYFDFSYFVLKIQV